MTKISISVYSAFTPSHNLWRWSLFFPVSGIECHPLVPVLAAMGISFVTSMGGLSGAFLLLPFQMSFLGYTSPGVSATNHLFNVLACPGGIVRYAREGRLLWPLALTVAVGTLPGIVLGSLIRVYWLPDESRFKVFAGLLLLWIFWRMFRDLRRPAAPARKGGGMARIHVERWDRSRLVFTFGEARHSVSCPRLAALSLGIGLAGGIYGIGGGAILSPFLVSIFGLPVHAIAGALLLGTFLASLAGVLGYGFLGLFSSLDGIGADPLLGLLLGLGGLMGSYLGARCQRFVPARRIKWGLALILLFTSLRYLWQGF